MSNAQTLPLSALRLDEKGNVRRQGRGADPVMMASIKAIGLRVPLSVRKNGNGYVVVDGGQRLAALQELQKQGEFADNCDVPVVITGEDDAGAREVSLALNITRQRMHPVDEFRAFATLNLDGLTVDSIAKRFGIEPKVVAQRLALGTLDDSVLTAWLEQRIDEKDAQAFTLAPSKKAQAAALKIVLGDNNFVNPYNIKRALGMTDDKAGKFLDLVGEENYIKRGGKITRDLFGSDHVISDPGLIKLMVDEVVQAKCAELEKDGWFWATTVVPDDVWNYKRVNLKGEPTKAEEKELKRLQKITEDESDDNTQEAMDAASDAYDKLEAEINARAVTPQIKAKAGVFVSVSHNGRELQLDYRFKPKAEPVSKAEAAKKEKAKAAKKAAPEDNVSQALMVRLAEQLNAATQATILNHPHVAMAALIAGIASFDSAVGIHAGTAAWDKKQPDFSGAFQSALKLTTAKQIEILTGHVSKAVNLVNRNAKEPALEHASYKTLAEAVDGKKLTAALREKFDAKDYFASVSRATIVDAVREAMGDDHATKVGAMDKTAAAKFATANLPKTKWLPKQLRVSGYDGPAKKAAKAKR